MATVSDKFFTIEYPRIPLKCPAWTCRWFDSWSTWTLTSKNIVQQITHQEMSVNDLTFEPKNQRQQINRIILLKHTLHRATYSNYLHFCYNHLCPCIYPSTSVYQSIKTRLYLNKWLTTMIYKFNHHYLISFEYLSSQESWSEKMLLSCAVINLTCNDAS